MRPALTAAAAAPASPSSGTAGRAPIPSEPSSNVTIDRVVIRQDDLRVVGDAGSLDLDRDRLEWSRGIVPTELPVMGALPGLYSRLLFELNGNEDGDEYAYEITGTVKIGNAFQPFTIRDTADLSLSLELAVTLPAGAAPRSGADRDRQDRGRRELPPGAQEGRPLPPRRVEPADPERAHRRARRVQHQRPGLSPSEPAGAARSARG